MNKDYIWDFDEDKYLEELSNIKLPDPQLFDYYKRLKNREILWNQDIDENIVELTQLIIQWNKEDKDKPIEERQKIKIFINSDGGCLNSVMHTINIIKLSTTPIITIGMGKCFSSGGLLLMGGHKGLRYIFETTEALIHDGSTGAIGNTGKVIDNLEYTKKIEDKTKEYILSHTTITKKEYDKNYRKDWWLMSDEIIKYGLADKVITDLSEIY